MSASKPCAKGPISKCSPEPSGPAGTAGATKPTRPKPGSAAGGQTAIPPPPRPPSSAAYLKNPHPPRCARGDPARQGWEGEGLHQPLNALSQSATGENWDRSG